MALDLPQYIMQHEPVICRYVRTDIPYSKMATTLVFFCLLANQLLLPRLRENILLNFEFKNEATRANLQENNRILKWQPFWNKLYTFFFPRRSSQ